MDRIESDTEVTNLISTTRNEDLESALIPFSRRKINLRNEDSTTPLMVAASLNRPVAVKILIKLGAKMEKVTMGENWTALLIAVKAKSYQSVKVLLQKGANPYHRSSTGQTALILATRHVRMMRVLVDHGADVNTCDNNGLSPLFHCIRKRCFEGIRQLLQNGAKVNHDRPNRLDRTYYCFY